MLSILELNICVNFHFFFLHALTEDDISQDSDCFSGLSNYKPVKRWRYVRLEKTCQCNEQVALLLKVLKCDKSVIPSIYEFRSLCCFHAYLTLDEAENLSELEEVEVIDFPSMSEVARKAKRTRSRTSNGLLKAKKQKTSMAVSIISQRRQNKEKWRYNEAGIFSVTPKYSHILFTVLGVYHHLKRCCIATQAPS
ncbi:hypothetical protein ES332_D13G275100v1 [Gossypium tomentosum]|uniref:Uncharacterized protein n=1 Tax=Gossypium tomentosum TaxID=34277 RepID=A0A5D2I214_GOSTO|nr:hypothetical protein ES332_D13G275100v1 [Gossypium tomentosum]